MLSIQRLINYYVVLIIIYRKQLQTEYKRRISDGDYAAEEPPGCFQISNMLCRDFFFCCGTPTDDKSKVKDTETAVDVDRRRSSLKRVHSLPGRCPYQTRKYLETTVYHISFSKLLWSVGFTERGATYSTYQPLAQILTVLL